MAMMMGTHGAVPPKSVGWAVLLTLINAIGGIAISIAWPDIEERATVIVVSTVLGVLMIGLVLLLRRGSRWGAFGTLGVNAFSILLGLPVFFQDDRSILAGAVVSIVLSVLTMGFVLRPDARAFWQKATATAS